jgi:hypothetical protein
MHDKPLIADNMEKKNCHCDPTSTLCFCQQETASHLLTECNYTEACWRKFALSFSLLGYDQLHTLHGLLEWLMFFQLTYKKNERRKKVGYLFKFWWHIWKERNHRIFDSKEKPVLKLWSLLQDEITSFTSAVS